MGIFCIRRKSQNGANSLPWRIAVRSRKSGPQPGVGGGAGAMEEEEKKEEKWFEEIGDG